MNFIFLDAKGTSMADAPKVPEGQPLNEKEMEEQFRAFQAAQQAYLEESFKWLIDHVAKYFPGDQLAIRDMELEVHFVHRVMEEGKPVGALVYRFRKFTDKKDYFKEMAEDYQEGLGLSDVLFVDSESYKFEAPSKIEGNEEFLEIPMDKLTGQIKELRESLKTRAKLRKLKDSL